MVSQLCPDGIFELFYCKRLASAGQGMTNRPDDVSGQPRNAETAVSRPFRFIANLS